MLEEQVVRQLKLKLQSKYLEASGDLDLDEVKKLIDQEIETLKKEPVSQTLAKKLPAEPASKQTSITNELTTDAIKRARQALYEILSEVIEDMEFDLNAFLNALVYWYELQGLAKACGKKLLYIAPKGGK